MGDREHSEHTAGEYKYVTLQNLYKHMQYYLQLEVITTDMYDGIWRSNRCVKKVISEEMMKMGVLQKDVPEDADINPSDVNQVMKNSKGRRYYRCKAFAHFGKHIKPNQPNKPDQSNETDQHDQPDQTCKHTWKSAHAWCVLDLKKQRIAHRWCQKCKQCEGKSGPWFDEEALQRMAEYAVNVSKEWKGRVNSRLTIIEWWVLMMRGDVTCARSWVTVAGRGH